MLLSTLRSLAFNSVTNTATATAGTIAPAAVTATTKAPGPKAVLSLYKNLLRYSNSLKYTDKEFYKRRIRQEFQKHKELRLREEAEIIFQYQKGIQFLAQRRII